MKIEIRNLTKVYGSGNSAVVALNELNLDLDENEICIVRGPNGSGKTTLISILSGELSPTVGEIRLNSDSEQKPNISVVKQFNNLINELTISEHFYKLGKSENLELVPSEILNRKPDQISRGQAQIVAMALALTTDTDLLLADEPTGALSEAESQTVYEFIKTAARKSKTPVILVTHDVNAERIADQVVRLRDGRISETWKPGESERQVISEKGWVRIPDQVLSGMENHVAIAETSSGAELIGRKNPATLTNSEFKKRQPTEQILISVKNLATKYGQTLVSTNLEFEIKFGELFCVFGKSGVGKTTLLQTISGLHTDFSGEINRNSIDSIPYFNIEQPYGLQLTLRELAVPDELLTKLKLNELSKRPLNTFSGGQHQRAVVALALASTDQIIALDEPTSALDDEMANLVIGVLLESPKTLIVASHDERLKEVANTTLLLS